MTVSETGELLTVLQTMWPNREVTEPVILAYQAALLDVDRADALAAAAAWMRDGKYFPVAAELRARLPKPAGPPALPAGPPPDDGPRHGKFVFRCWDADLDGYEELPEPIPATPANLAEERRRFAEGTRRLGEVAT